MDELTPKNHDDYSVVVSKFHQGINHNMLENKIKKLQGCFDMVSPWHKEFFLKFIRRYELIGVPLQVLE